MSSLLRAGRILSSDENNSVKQEQKVDVNIKVQSNPKQDTSQSPTCANSVPHCGTQNQHLNQHNGISAQHSVPLYPTINQGISAHPSAANFTIPVMEELHPSQFQSVQASQQIPDIIDHQELLNEIEDLKVKNQFLELLLSAHENNPLKINNLLIVNHRILIEMVKLLCGAQRVDLVLNEDITANCGCCGTNDSEHDELIYISRILVTKDDKTSDLKICYNEVFSQFIKWGISLKICCR